jgi:hypothetical protein
MPQDYVYVASHNNCRGIDFSFAAHQIWRSLAKTLARRRIHDSTVNVDVESSRRCTDAHRLGYRRRGDFEIQALCRIDKRC